MYTGLIACVVIIISYFAIMAICSNFGNGTALFTGRATLCVIIGSILGIFVSAPLFSVSRMAGYLGIAVSIGLMYILLFSGVINAIIRRIPESIRNAVRMAFKVVRVALIITVIICTVIGVLAYWGV